MRKYRFFCSQPLENGQEVLLNEELAHYICRVLRLELQEIIYLFNNSGNEFTVQISAITKHTVQATIIAVEASSTESPLDLHLGLGIIKFDNIDLVLQKACELGVTRISLIATEHTSIKNAATRAHDKLAHWHKVLANAAGQCWRAQLPHLEILPKLDDFITNEPSLKLILDPRALTTAPLPSQIANKAVKVLIGPEGGFSEPEVLLAQNHGFIGINLGPRILRAETAALCAATLLQAKYGDLLC